MVNFRKALIILGLLSISFGASAAIALLDPYTLDPTEVSGSLNGGYTVNITPGLFSETIEFEIVNAPLGGAEGSANIISVQFGTVGIDTSKPISAVFDGAVDFVADLSNPVVLIGSLVGFVTNGVHTITIEGTALTGGATLSGNVGLKAIPLPATVWLFGSALVGLFGVQRRSTKVSA
jgi:hypothetical protein